MVPDYHVVKEGKIGDTSYRICDDAYRNLTQADISRTLYNIHAIGRRILNNTQKRRQL